MDTTRLRRTGAFLASAAMLSSLTIATVAAPAAAAPNDAVLPDMIEALPDHLQIQNSQQGESLRFTTVHINNGEGNLQVRGGGQVAPCTIDGIDYDQCTVATQEFLDADGKVVGSQDAGTALFHPEHNHWHQSAVALFDIRTNLRKASSAVAQGVKITFCFVDVETISTTGAEKKQYPRTYFDCNGALQGIAAHWADSYHQSTPLQELDISDVPSGTYYLTHTADPENHWAEADESNNFTWLQIKLSGHGGNRKVTIVDHAPCDPEVVCGFGGNP